MWKITLTQAYLRYFSHRICHTDVSATGQYAEVVWGTSLSHQKGNSWLQLPTQRDTMAMLAAWNATVAVAADVVHDDGSGEPIASLRI